MKRLHKALLMPWTNKVNYTQIVQNTAAANLLAYWPMAESSGSVALDASGNARNGAYTGVTLGAAGIGDGRTSASFNGTTSFNNVYSASLAAAFNKDEGTAAAWCKVSGAGVWTDGVARFVLRLAADANNLVALVKQSGNNRFDCQYAGGGTFRLQSLTSAPVGYFHAAITWSVAANQVIVYFNGSAVGSPLAIPTFTGALATTTTMIGAGSTTPAQIWSGSLAHAAVWNTPLSAAQIAALAVVP
jgi:concanavalin A-like lectin/glucanase superfamily protein